jgi:hypothetical protein
MELVKNLRNTFQEWSYAEQKGKQPEQIHAIGSKLKVIVGELDGILYQYATDQEEEAKKRISPTIERYLAEGKAIAGPDIKVTVQKATGLGIGYTITAALSWNDDYRWGVTWTNNPLHLNLLVQALTKPNFSL